MGWFSADRGRNGPFTGRRPGLSRPPAASNGPQRPAWLAAADLPQPDYAWDADKGFYLAMGRSFASPAHWIASVGGSVVCPSKRLVVDRSGQLVEIAPHEPAVDWSDGIGGLLVEGARTNLVRNNTLVGARLGVIGGGAFPSSWRAAPTGVPNIEVLWLGQRAGIDVMRVRFWGVPTTTFGQIWGPSGTPGLAGEVYTSSLWWSWTGSAANVVAPALRLAGEPAFTNLPTDGSFARRSNTRALSSDVSADLTIRWNYINTVTPVDFVVEVGLPQLEKADAASSPIRTSGAAVTRAASQGIDLPWARSGPVSMVVEAQSELPTRNPATGQASSAMSAEVDHQNRIQLRQRNVSPYGPEAHALASGLSQGSAALGGTPFTTRQRVGLTFDADQFRMFKDAAISAIDTTAIVPETTLLRIGNGSTGVVWDGSVSKGAAWSSRLTDAQMIAVQQGMAA